MYPQLQGFLTSWVGDGVRGHVLAHIQKLYATAAVPAETYVLCCGHSLGGALASLAAIEIVNECKLRPGHVKCYTFGCPRIGNHAFAEDFAANVPATWHAINDQDLFAHGMKLRGCVSAACLAIEWQTACTWQLTRRQRSVCGVWRAYEKQNLQECVPASCTCISCTCKLSLYSAVSHATSACHDHVSMYPPRHKLR